MENNNEKKITISPPGGALLARYTVRCKPVDVFKRRMLLDVVPMILWSAVKATVVYWILKAIRFGIAWVLGQFLDLHEKIDEIVNMIDGKFRAFGWIFTAIFVAYAVYLAARIVYTAVTARTRGREIAEATLPEEYAFYGDGILYSNGMDLIRIPYKKVRLVTYGPLGMVIHAGSICSTLIIPPRYFCTEYPVLREGLKEALGVRFWRFKKTWREHEPMYPDPGEARITQEAPTGDVIAEMTIRLRFTDLGYLYKLWERLIARKYNRGVFGMVLLTILAAALIIASFAMQEPVLLTSAGVLLAAMIAYGIFLVLRSMLRGRRLLCNSGDYRKPVRYVFYPAGFLTVYDNGVSFVKYEDLDVIIEDMEGLGFFFSKKKCLFLPRRSMVSVAGNRLSHFFKDSLFNLDPSRGDRKIAEE